MAALDKMDIYCTDMWSNVIMNKLTKYNINHHLK